MNTDNKINANSDEIGTIDGLSADFFSRRSFLKKAIFAPFALAAFSEAQAVMVGGVDYLSIAEFAKYLGFKYKTVVAKKQQLVYSKYTEISFEVNQRDALLNGRKLCFGSPIAEIGGMLYFSRKDYQKTFLPILFPQNSGKPRQLYHIVLDAGHGGKDVGAVNKKLGLYEKNLALDMVLRVGKVLSEKGYKVSYTRTKDVFVELDNRIAYANKLKADMFVSLHFNSAGESAYGLETYALTPAGQPSSNSAKPSASDKVAYDGNACDNWNALLAYYVQSQIVGATGLRDRGLRRARFAVLRPADMPAVLVEGGFLSNASDASKIATSAYRSNLATGIVSGILKYNQTINRLRGK